MEPENSTIDLVSRALDFERPLLDAGEERVLASTRREPDLAVDGLGASLLSRLLGRLQRNP